MTSKKRATQLDSEDEERGGNPKGKIIARRIIVNLKNSLQNVHSNYYCL